MCWQTVSGGGIIACYRVHKIGLLRPLGVESCSPMMFMGVFLLVLMRRSEGFLAFSGSFPAFGHGIPYASNCRRTRYRLQAAGMKQNQIARRGTGRRS